MAPALGRDPGAGRRPGQGAAAPITGRWARFRLSPASRPAAGTAALAADAAGLPLPTDGLPPPRTHLPAAPAAGEGARRTRLRRTRPNRADPGRPGLGSGRRAVPYLGWAARVPRCRDTSRAGCPRSPSARSASLACRTSRRHPSVAFR